MQEEAKIRCVSRPNQRKPKSDASGKSVEVPQQVVLVLEQRRPHGPAASGPGLVGGGCLTPESRPNQPTVFFAEATADVRPPHRTPPLLETKRTLTITDKTTKYCLFFYSLSRELVPCILKQKK
jgi:hypothetical protein